MSQKTETGDSIAFSFADDGTTIKSSAPSLTDLKFPVKFTFPIAFKDKEIQITNPDNQTLTGVYRFGSSDFSKDAGGKTYTLLIKKDRVINPSPGDEKINGESAILIVNGTRFPFSFAKDQNEEDNAEPTDYKAGNMYRDALKLAELSTADNQDNIIGHILAYYKITLTDLENNPYLKEVLAGYIIRQKGADPHNAVGNIASLVSGIGNTDVTYFAAGLARFLAERAKEELNTAFFDKMKEQMQAYPELKTVFPKTADFMETIDNYSYASVIQVLKEAFQTDIQNLSTNLYGLKELQTDDCSGKKEDECIARIKKLNDFFGTKTGLWTSLGMRTLKETATAANPADLLNEVTISNDLTELKAYVQKRDLYPDLNSIAVIELANFISISLLSDEGDSPGNEEGRVWINSTQLNTLIKNKKAFTAYLGLLFAAPESKEITFYVNAAKKYTLNDILKTAKENAATYATYENQLINLIKNTQTAFNAADNAIDKIRHAVENSTEADAQSLYNYYQTFAGSARSIAHSEVLENITGVKIGAQYDKVEEFLTPAVDLAYHIAAKSYSAALYDALMLLNKADSTDKTLDDQAAKVFVKYGTLISSVANAQSSDEVKTALEASMLPSGSSAIKRNSSWNIAVNAYVGGYWGYAHSYSRDANHSAVKYQTYGLYAPVGISFSKGIKFGSLSATAQVLDLGALVNFYLLNGDQTALPDEFKVRLSNIFAPGVQVAWNIPKTPLTLGFGWQFVPALYQTSQISGGSEITASTAQRLHFSLVVDLPLLNIATWDYKK
jgi:hypothetical protein